MVDFYSGDTNLRIPVVGEIKGIRGNQKYGRRRHYVDIAAIPLGELPRGCRIQYRGEQFVLVFLLLSHQATLFDFLV